MQEADEEGGILVPELAFRNYDDDEGDMTEEAATTGGGGSAPASRRGSPRSLGGSSGPPTRAATEGSERGGGDGGESFRGKSRSPGGQRGSPTAAAAVAVGNGGRADAAAVAAAAAEEDEEGEGMLEVALDETPAAPGSAAGSRNAVQSSFPSPALCSPPMIDRSSRRSSFTSNGDLARDIGGGSGGGSNSGSSGRGGGDFRAGSKNGYAYDYGNSGDDDAAAAGAVSFPLPPPAWPGARCPDDRDGAASTAGSDESDRRAAGLTAPLCTMDGVNLGGPGWFRDVFDVAVALDGGVAALDTPAMAAVPSAEFKRRIRLFDADEPISGVVDIKAPFRRWVWCSGITVTLEEHLVAADGDLDGGDVVGSISARAASGHWIRDDVVAKFSLSPRAMARRRGWPARDTYVGEVVAVRHVLVVTISRPWYTFDVVRHIPLMIQRLCPPPSPPFPEAEGEAEGVAAAGMSLPPQVPPAASGGASVVSDVSVDATYASEEAEAAAAAAAAADRDRNRAVSPPGNHLLVVEDCGGRCELDLGPGGDHADIEGALTGTLSLRGIIRPLASITLVVIRAEVVGGGVADSVVCEHAVVGRWRRARRHSSAATSRQEKGTSGRRRDGDGSPPPPPPPVGRMHPRCVTSRQLDPPAPPPPLSAGAGPRELAVRLELQPLPLTPTIATLTRDILDIDDEEDLLAVRYYLRLLLEDDRGVTYWNTHEIFLYRTKLNPLELVAAGDENDVQEDDEEDDEDDDYDNEEDEVVAYNGDGGGGGGKNGSNRMWSSDWGGANTGGPALKRGKAGAVTHSRLASTARAGGGGRPPLAPVQGSPHLAAGEESASGGRNGRGGEEVAA
ncbi:unnamed protein product [Phaeothamnion confervicola]